MYRSKLVALAGSSVLAALLSWSHGMAAPGGSLDVGTAPGESVAIGTVYDQSLRREYKFGLRAEERTDQPGRGDVAFNIFGPRLSLCSVFGPGAFVDFSVAGQEGPGIDPEETDPDAEPVPLYPTCGRAGGNAVKIDGCVATIQLHGFQHSDYFFESYLGPVPVDIRFQKTGPNSGHLDVTAWFGNKKVQINGKTTGAVAMSTCAD